MDVHVGFVGVSQQQFQEAHQRDLDLEKDEGVPFEPAWLDLTSGTAFCISTGPNNEAVS